MLQLQTAVLTIWDLSQRPSEDKYAEAAINSFFRHIPEDLWAKLHNGHRGQENTSKWSLLFHLWTSRMAFWLVYCSVAAATFCVPTTNHGEQCEDVIIVDNLKVSCQAVATLSWITERKISDGKQRSLLYRVTVFDQWKNQLILWFQRNGDLKTEQASFSQQRWLFMCHFVRNMMCAGLVVENNQISFGKNLLVTCVYSLKSLLDWGIRMYLTPTFI